MDVCYKIWEQSWESGAVPRDRKKGILADPTKVHGINHSGRYFKVPGVNLSGPSTQRTPVLYQAGISKRGKDFAAKDADCSFVSPPTPAITTEYLHVRRNSPNDPVTA